MITKLKENEIFVFGSNLAGIHTGGAALQAKEQFGAIEGVGEGITGQCYAFPTLDENFKTRGHQEFVESVRKFYKSAEENPDKIFLMTKVGTGIAGQSEEYMRLLFKQKGLKKLKNIIKPLGW